MTLQQMAEANRLVNEFKLPRLVLPIYCSSIVSVGVGTNTTRATITTILEDISRKPPILGKRIRIY